MGTIGPGLIGTHSMVWGDKLLYGHVPDPFPRCGIGSGHARLGSGFDVARSHKTTVQPITPSYNCQPTHTTTHPTHSSISARHELIILFFPPYHSIPLFQPNSPIILQAIFSLYSHGSPGSLELFSFLSVVNYPLSVCGSGLKAEGPLTYQVVPLLSVATEVLDSGPPLALLHEHSSMMTAALLSASTCLVVN